MILDLLTDEALSAMRQKIWKAYGYETFEPEVDRFHASNAKTKFVTSPARTAKSYSGAADVLPDIIITGILLQMSLAGQLRDEDGNEIVIETTRGWVVCPNYDLAKEYDYLYRDLIERAEAVPWGYDIRRATANAHNGDMEMVLFWGKNQRGEDVESIIEVRTSANERSLQSEELDWCLLSEAARLEQIVWTKYLSTRCGRSVWPTTPDVQAAWIYELIQQAEEYPGLGMESFNFTGRANPKYDWERYWKEHQKAEIQIKNQVLTFPGDVKAAPSKTNGHDCFDDRSKCQAAKQDGFAEQFLGKWVFHRGRVVPIRLKEGANGQPPHVIRQDRTWFRHADLHLSIDYGFADGCAALFWLVGHEQVCLRKSIYEKGLTPDKLVEKCEQMFVWFDIEYERQDMLKRIIGDPKKPEVAETFRQRGLSIFDVNKHAQADRQAGHLEFMNALDINIETGEPGLLIHAENIEVISEWRKLRRSERARDESSPTAFIGDDHAYDSTRYFLMTRPVRKFSEKKEGLTEFDRIRLSILQNRADASKRDTLRVDRSYQSRGGMYA